MRPSWLVLPFLLTTGCTFDLGLGPQLVDDFSAFHLTSDDITADHVADRIAVGSAFHLRWTRDTPETSIISTDPSILEVGEPYWEDDDLLFPATALATGTATVRAMNGDEVLDEEVVEVVIPESVRVVPFAATQVPEPPSAYAFAAGQEHFVRVYYFAGLEPVAARLPLPSVRADGLRFEPADAESAAYATMWLEIDAGETLLEVPTSDGGTLSTRVTAVEDIEQVGVTCGPNLFGSFCLAVGQANGVDVFGLPATWSFADGTALEGEGDVLEHLLGEGEQQVAVTYGGVSTTTTVPGGEVAVIRSNSHGCSQLPAPMGVSLLLLSLLGVRRQTRP